MVEKQTPPPEQLPGEVVEYYEHCRSREVVETYVQPRPLPGTAPSAPGKKRKKTGLWIFLVCIAAVAALTAGALLRPSIITGRGDSSADTGKGQTEQTEQTESVSIPTYDVNEDVRMEITSRQGPPLTAQEIYEKVNPSVVTVLVQLRAGASVGTGVIFTEDGYVLTNYHVVAGGRDCSVTLADNSTYSAKYVAGDSNNDLAVLKVDADGLPAAEIGSSDNLVVGDKVYAIGNPLGVELRGTFTDGIVSAINRDVEVDGRVMTLVQTNAALNSGNSGGPLINGSGQVVGINTIKMSSAFSSIEGLGFAIPSSSMQYIVNDLLKYGKVRPEPLLGVSVRQYGTTLSDGTVGVEVLEVSDGSAADKAGVRVGDVITSADGTDVHSSTDLLRVRRRFNVGDQMKLTVFRSGKYQVLTLDLTEAAD
jgi:serine protease Do